MDASEYIDTVTGQMRCKRARAMVAKELSAHIIDQTEDYLQEGMEPTEAEKEAVRQMGDAVEVGMEMDRLHRPRMDKKTLIIVGIFSVAAIFLQTMIVQALRVADQYYGSSKMVPLQILLGISIMVAILYFDYTLLGKYSMKIWVVLLLLPIVMNSVRVMGTSTERLYIYFLLGLFLPAYAGVLYHYRGKRWLGVLLSIFWLLLGILLYMNWSYATSSMGFLTGFAGILLLSYALAKGWFGIPKVPALAVTWGSMAVIGGIGLYMLYQSELSAARLQAFLDYYTLGEFSDPYGSGYIPYHMRESMRALEFFAPSEKWLSYWTDGPVESALSFFMVLNQLGILPALLLVIGLGVLFISMAAGVSKQKNVLGSLLGMACLLSLMIPTVGHILTNVTLLPYTDVPIPFLYPGWVANAACYTLLGFYLSVHRYTDVVA